MFSLFLRYTNVLLLINIIIIVVVVVIINVIIFVPVPFVMIYENCAQTDLIS